jgi:hypothetical protein
MIWKSAGGEPLVLFLCLKWVFGGINGEVGGIRDKFGGINHEVGGNLNRFGGINLKFGGITPGLVNYTGF